MEKQNRSLSSVLLADDDSEDKEIFCIALSEVRPGLRVKTVNNGKELLQMLETEKVDLIFLDINMFPVNGMEALKALKEQHDYAGLPVVMYSSSGNPKDVHLSYELGANLFFRKTETYPQLKAALDKILEMDWTKPEKIRTQFFDTRFPA